MRFLCALDDDDDDDEEKKKQGGLFPLAAQQPHIYVRTIFLC